MTIKEARNLMFSLLFYISASQDILLITNKYHFSIYFIGCEHIFLKYSFHTIL